MFTDVNIEDYDLKNDLHRARFFRDCLKDEIVFRRAIGTKILWKNGWYEGLVTPLIAVYKKDSKNKNNCEITYIETLLCFVMDFSFEKAKNLIRLWREENKVWTEKRDEEFEKINTNIGYVAGETKRDQWLKNNPFKFSENIDIDVLIAFKENFSTEHNILMALRHLSMIL